MISQSSKRLSKIKKKLQKNDASDYQFLIRSLSRDNNKENNPMNKPENETNSVKYSIQLNKPSRINSMDKYQPRLNNSLENGQFSKINLKNSPILLFENVKFLKSSRMDAQCSEKRLDISKATYRKNIQLSQNGKSKQIERSSKFTENLDDNFQNKLQAYVSFANELFDEILKIFKGEITSQFARKKCLLTTLGKQILRQMSKKNERELGQAPSKSIQISHFCSFPSRGFSKELQKSSVVRDKPDQNEFKKKIDDLQNKNSKLTQLISQHERKNIKMFIQMNENQSKEIQKCKKYLSSLYDKYKLLEKSIIKESQKYQQASKKNVQMQKFISQLKSQNDNLRTEVQRRQGILSDNEFTSKISFEDDSHCTMVDFNPNSKRRLEKSEVNNYNLSVMQNDKIDKSLVTKREKATSCLGNHFGNVGKQDDLMSCSTITKNKNMKKKKQKSPTRINVKNKLHQINSDQINSQLKKEMVDLRNKISEQKKQNDDLQTKVEDLQRKVVKSNEKVSKMEFIINEQLQEIQKLMKVNTEIVSLMKSIKKDTLSENIKQEKDGILKKLKQTQKLICLSSKKDKKAKEQDGYRIIAMQAGVLQKLLNFS